MSLETDMHAGAFNTVEESKSTGKAWLVFPAMEFKLTAAFISFLPSYTRARARTQHRGTRTRTRWLPAIRRASVG